MTERRTVKCYFCDFETDNVHALFSHLLTTHCDEHGYFVGDKKEEKKEEGGEKYVCAICGKFESKDAEDLIVHILQNHHDVLMHAQKFVNKKTLKCKLCGYIAKSLEECTMHVVIYHLDDVLKDMKS